MENLFYRSVKFPLINKKIDELKYINLFYLQIQ